SYHLYYGNPKAVPPTYDITRISSYLQENTIASAFLGDETTNPAYVAPAGPVVPFTEAHKYLLNTLLVLVVVILLGAIGWYLRTFMKGKGAGKDGGNDAAGNPHFTNDGN